MVNEIVRIQAKKNGYLNRVSGYHLLLIIILLLHLISFAKLLSKSFGRHLSQSCTRSFHFSIPYLSNSSSTLSSHLFLGLPRGLFPWGTRSRAALNASFSILRIMCPSHCIPWHLIKLVTYPNLTFPFPPVIHCCISLAILPCELLVIVFFSRLYFQKSSAFFPLC